VADLEAAGREMHGWIAGLYPICRSITGEGLRTTLRAIQANIPLEIREVPSGQRVLDWTVPDEWNIRDAWVANRAGRRVIDFRRSNLHVVSYSVPVRRRVSLTELKKHLFTLPEHPDWIPYRTSYYEPTWGFCASQRVALSLSEPEYDVVIDSTLAPGSLSYGEWLLPGAIGEEVLISCHVCHPSLANDNLSGIAVATRLARALAAAPRRYSYRFLFLPGTIGSITWLALNAALIGRIRHGLVVACVGDPGPLRYKKSRRGDAEIDRAASHVLTSSGRPHELLDFSPYGYDERQYCSPGFDLPVGSLTRTPHGRYPEYHTSADDLGLVRPESLADSLDAYLRVVQVLEGNGRYLNTSPRGEPQLGRRGLYRAMGGMPDPGLAQMAMLWVLNWSDGKHDLLEIAEKASLPFEAVRSAAEALEKSGLLLPAPEPSPASAVS